MGVQGLAADNLLEAEVVLADGSVVRASADEHPDLFWALRGGGGGHLGVVTSLTFDTFAAPTMSTAYLQWPLEAVPDVLPVWEAWAPVADVRLWSTLKGLAGARHPSGPVLAAAVTWVGPDDGLTGRLDRFLADVPRPSYSSRQRRSFAEVTKAYAGSPARERFAGTSHVAYDRLGSAGLATFVDRLGDAQDTDLVEAGISLDSLGGRVGALTPGDTAFVHREALATVQYTAVHAAGDRAAALGFVRGARAAMVPSWGEHAYVNYADDALRHYRAAYFGANASRLADVAARWDPDGFFTQPQDY
jgi:FAD/FMN-containing dehydrogenase